MTDIWILYVFSKPIESALVVASRYGSIHAAVADGKTWEKIGYYYRVENYAIMPMKKTGTEG